MNISNKLTHKQTLKQQLTPQLRQGMSLLQMSSIELEQAIDDALNQNPLLERIHISDEEYIDDNEHAVKASSRLARSVQDLPDIDIFESIPDDLDFYEELHQQVCELTNNERMSQLLHILIEYLDEHGYLVDSLEEIIEQSPLELRLEKVELEQALELLHQFEPAGIGAKNLQESLLLQLARQPENEIVNCAIKIVSDCFEVLGKSKVNLEKNILALIKQKSKLDVNFDKSMFNEQLIADALGLIRRLNPYPSQGMAGDSVYIVPDIKVYKEDGVWKAFAAPHLKPQVVVNKELEQKILLQDWSSDIKNANQMLKDANLLVQNLEWRENTIFQVAKFIVERQQDFFDFGDMALNPIKMQEVSEALDVHLSTISRSVNQKYLICPQGLFELRYFFSKEIIGEDSDDSMSQTAIKAHIASWIEAEDKNKPFSDEVLCQKLESVGIKISRRAVAKYREAMNIPSTYLRKKQ